MVNIQVNLILMLIPMGTQDLQVLHFMEDMEKEFGDCWDNSEMLYQKLKSQGNDVRIIQYPTSLSSNHRSVQYYSNGKWVDYDYKGNGYKKVYYATSNKNGATVVKQ